jgi:regulator of RNase E activity RraB
MLETEDGALSCLIDVGYAESCPDGQRPLFTMVRFPFQEPGEHGFGSEEERGAIGDIEDTIAQKGEKHRIIHVASVRGCGNLDALFYSPTAAKTHLQSIIKDACTDLEVEVASLEDPEWEQYQDLFPPDEAIEEYNDRRVIQALTERGDRLERDRPVNHILMLPSNDAADQAARAAAKLGYQESDRHESPQDELPITLQLTKSHNVEIETITQRRGELAELVASLEGTYDGWESPIVK